MEIPSFGGGKKEERRSKAERRTRVPDAPDRRSGAERRGDTLARAIVLVLDKLHLALLARVARTLAERKLLGPGFMCVSAVISFAGYSLVFGIAQGAIIILALVIHESGHFVFALRRTYRPHWWWFIPFLGAMMSLPSMKNRSDEAWFAIGGPVFGTIASLLAFLVWRYAPLEGEMKTLVYDFALVSTVLNLFNLTPISPLDGGRVTQAVHVSFQWLGFAALIFFSWLFKYPSLLLVWMLVATERFLAYPLWRFASACLIFLIMAVLMYHGWGSGETMAEAIAYLGFGAVLVLLARPTDLAPVECTAPEGARPELPLGERVAWGAAWASITTVLLLLFLFLLGA